jgi:diaminopimelate decarboxylase
MDHFRYRDGRLYAEDVDVSELAQRFGTPCYVYSRATLERHWHAFDLALAGHPHLVCYAVKANANLAVLQLLARLGSGFDIVSIGELERVLLARGDPGKVVFSGVGKRPDEILRTLEVGIRCFNVESSGELSRLDLLAARSGKRAPVAIRVNPDVDAATHPYIATGLKENKFGIDLASAVTEYQRAATLRHIEVVGIDCHIGSQLTQLEPYVEALARVIELAHELERKGIPIRHIDMGGGLGIRYRDESPPEPAEYASALRQRLSDQAYELIVEPGRAIVGNAGILLTRVEYLKHTPHKNFAIVDAAMNDLIRPSLYQAWQAIVPAVLRDEGGGNLYDIVGPVCESGDFLGKDRRLDLRPGDLLAVRSAGAYGFSMSSNYNARARAAELVVDGERVHLVRARETLAQMTAGENLLPT